MRPRAFEPFWNTNVRVYSLHHRALFLLQSHCRTANMRRREFRRQRRCSRKTHLRTKRCWRPTVTLQAIPLKTILNSQAKRTLPAFQAAISLGWLVRLTNACTHATGRMPVRQVAQKCALDVAYRSRRTVQVQTKPLKTILNSQTMRVFPALQAAICCGWTVRLTNSSAHAAGILVTHHARHSIPLQH